MLLKGFVEEETGIDFDLFREIERLKKEKNAVILAHYYQDSDIQDIADYVGDSLGLSRQAAATKAEIILFAGVHFMAETARILSPNKKVLLPDLNAGCSLADSCPPEKFKAFIAANPKAVVVSYVNCSAAVKAMTDIICTSANAEGIINSLPRNQEIIFAPDKNLGKYLEKKTGRKLILWDGACMVHEIFSLMEIEKILLGNPDAELIAHPECTEDILERAAFIGSTSELLAHTAKSATKTFVVATETGILHQMIKKSPEKVFLPAPPNNTCACNDCPHMKLNTLEKVYLALKNETPEITLEEEILNRALKPINRMLQISKELGL
jgi:quinolinate synthase